MEDIGVVLDVEFLRGVIIFGIVSGTTVLYEMELIPLLDLMPVMFSFMIGYKDYTCNVCSV